MPQTKPAKAKPLGKTAVRKPPPERPPPKIGLPTQLAAIQDRYRRAMVAVYDHPEPAQAGMIHAAIQTMLAEKAALGVKDGEEAAAGAE